MGNNENYPEDYPEVDEDEQAMEEAVEKQMGKTTDFEMHEWSVKPTPVGDALKTLGLTKEMALTKLNSEKEIKLAKIKYDILLCTITDFPEKLEVISSCYADLSAFLLLHMSDKGWAREWMRTTKYALEKFEKEMKKQRGRII